MLLDVVLFNPAWWNKLPPNHRKTITDIFTEQQPLVDKLKSLGRFAGLLKLNRHQVTSRVVALSSIFL